MGQPQESAARETFLRTVSNLVEFIKTNKTFEAAARSGHAGSTFKDEMVWLNDIVDRYLQYGSGRSGKNWQLSANALSLFLRKAPEFWPVIRPISHIDKNVSTNASHDPLTSTGLGDVLNFVDNGLLDDGWLALYEKDGERRIVGEALDDFLRWNQGKFDWTKQPGLDKDEAWFRCAQRTYLDWDTFYTAFADDLKEIETKVPSPEDLMALWLARPYEDWYSNT